MGSYIEPNAKRVDHTAGVLVWVRRRNGSWWPGLVMSPEGLPRRRKGTPVKLLGREDGSMDWYDLQKSKRIKAFRCGEYDECIEKAKAAACCSNKSDRIGKYARREDAIIQALELERIYHSNGDLKFCSGVNISSSTAGFRDTCKEKFQVTKKSNKVECKKAMELSHSFSSLEYNKTLSANRGLSVKKRKWKTLNDYQEDGTKGTKRMRDLQDLGPVVKSKSVYGIIHGVGSNEQALLDDASIVDTNFDSNCSCMSLVDHKNDLCSSMKRKRQMTEANEVFKRKNRRRPLTKVLESTARVNEPLTCNKTGSPDRTFLQEVGQNKLTALDSSESKKTDLSVVINNSSDYSENSCEDISDARENVCHDAFEHISFPSEFKDDDFFKDNDFSSTFTVDDDELFNGLVDVPIYVEESYTGDFSYTFPPLSSKSIQNASIEEQLDLDESIQISEKNISATYITCERIKSSKGASNWQSKGKRKSQTTGTRSIIKATVTKDPPESYLLNRFHKEESFVGTDSKSVSNSFRKSFEADNSSLLVRCGLAKDQPAKWSPEISDTAYNFDGQGLETKPLVTCSGAVSENIHCNAPPCETQKELSSTGVISEHLSPRSLPYRNIKMKDKSPAASCLYDVNVEVQASFNSHQVHKPLVSLTSRLNGKAIVGHAVTVQLMENCSSDAFLSSANGFPSTISFNMYDGENMSNKAMDVVDVPLLQDGFGSIVGGLRKQTRRTTKSRQKGRRKPCDRFQCPSLHKTESSKIKKPGLLSRKMRRLSSITIDHGKKEVKSEPVVKLGGPVVACVPLKLVFSRIHEALSCFSQQGHM